MTVFVGIFSPIMKLGSLLILPAELCLSFTRTSNIFTCLVESLGVNNNDLD